MATTQRRNGSTQRATAMAAPPIAMITGTDAVAKADAMEIAGALNSVVEARNEVDRALTQLGDRVVDQLRSYVELKKAIEVKHADLATLHDKEVVLKDLADLHNLIETQRVVWQADQAAEQRRREEAEKAWQHAHMLRVSSEEAKWQTDLREVRRQEEERRYGLETGWKQREGELAKREQSMRDAEALIATFDAKVKAESDRQTNIAFNAMKRDLEHKQALELATAKAENQRLADRNEALLTGQRDRDGEIGRLRQALDVAQEKAAATVRAALDSASGRQALEQVQATVAAAQPTGKR